MNKEIIDLFPDLYKELLPYINYMESVNIKQDKNNIYIDRVRSRNIRYFNDWRYIDDLILSKNAYNYIVTHNINNTKFYYNAYTHTENFYIADLASQVTEKSFIEVYLFKKIPIKTPVGTFYIIENHRDKDYNYKSLIINNEDPKHGLEIFKKEINKFLYLYNSVKINNKMLECKLVDV